MQGKGSPLRVVRPTTAILDRIKLSYTGSAQVGSIHFAGFDRCNGCAFHGRRAHSRIKERLYRLTAFISSCSNWFIKYYVIVCVGVIVMQDTGKDETIFSPLRRYIKAFYKETKQQ